MIGNGKDTNNMADGVDTTTKVGYNELKKKVERVNERAAQYGAIGRITVQDWVRISEKKSGRCWICGTWEGPNLTIEHLIPMSAGGSNTARNLMATCKTCNETKHRMFDQPLVEIRDGYITGEAPKNQDVRNHMIKKVEGLSGDRVRSGFSMYFDWAMINAMLKEAKKK